MEKGRSSAAIAPATIASSAVCVAFPVGTIAIPVSVTVVAPRSMGTSIVSSLSVKPESVWDSPVASASVPRA
jgi:hypothetical protein